MSFINQAQDPRSRLGGLAATVAVNGAIGILLVTGLTNSGLGPKPDTYDPIIDFTTPKPPPPPEPAPSPSATIDQPFVAPMPPIPLPPMQGPKVDEFDPSFVISDVVPRADPGPPAPTPRPAPSFTPKAARPSNDAARWITTDDYPRGPLVDGSEGLARYRLVIGTGGQVSICEVTGSTGDRRLDEATCRFITRRARFEAATDENGAKVLGTYSGTVRWQIPD